MSFEVGGEGLACLQALPEFSRFNPGLEVLHCLKPGAGCRDAPRCFSLKLRHVAEQFGLLSASVDSELEVLHQEGELRVAIVKHVDDLKMIGPREVIESFIKRLTSVFGPMDIERRAAYTQHSDVSVSLDQNKSAAARKPTGCELPGLRCAW